jgi:hypothetical protein
MAVFGVVNGKAREEQASLRDALDSVSSHSRRKSAEHAFAGGSSNYPPSPMGAPPGGKPSRFTSPCILCRDS